jgi:hypothetical protein
MLLVLHWQQGPDGRAPQRQPSSSATAPVVPYPVDGQTTQEQGQGWAGGIGSGGRCAWREQRLGLAAWGQGRVVPKPRAQTAQRRARGGTSGGINEEEEESKTGGGRDVDENDIWGPARTVHSKELDLARLLELITI